MIDVSRVERPNITEAQILALMQWVASTALAMGLCSEATSKVVVIVGSAILGAVLTYADAHLRGKRNEVLAAEVGATPNVL